MSIKHILLCEDDARDEKLAVNGLEVLRTLRADERLKSIPVVGLSSSREMPDVAEGYKHGINAYVVKPVDFTDFMNAVKLPGGFWATVNEPPPNPGSIVIAGENQEAVPSKKHKGNNEISTPHPAPGR